MKKLFLIIIPLLFLSSCKITISNEVGHEEIKDKPVKTEETTDGLQLEGEEITKAEESAADEEKKEEETMVIKISFSSTKDNKDLIDCHKTEWVTRTVPKTKAVAQTALEQLFIGPTEKEMQDGLVKFNPYDAKVSDYIKRIFVKGDTIYVDWVDFRDFEKPFFWNSSSSGCNVMAPLKETLTQFPNINKIVQAFDGDPSDFYNWIQRGCLSENDEYCDPTPFQ